MKTLYGLGQKSNILNKTMTGQRTSRRKRNKHAKENAELIKTLTKPWWII
ncbi:MAG: hypothetical protein M0P71_01790 [Melioribacteraceae bacterium]|nr:hypothetical protein [Melioribacteraceae bacterium]